MSKRDKTCNSRPLFIAAIILLMIPSLYWAITGHVWEDFLITFRQAANLIEGQGLTYNEGTLLHSFTSPLNVLVIALMGWIAGPADFALPLLLYTMVSLACLATGGLLTTRLLLQENPNTNGFPWTVLLFPLILVLSVCVTAFAMNGQEAGFWILFLGISFVAAFRGYATHWLLAGVGWAGLMWTRPDSPIHITLFGLAAILFPVADRKEILKGIMKAAGTCTVFYLPWFTWAWWYYGSPVPHTIIAKANATGALLEQELSLSDWLHKGVEFLAKPLLPIYYMQPDWPALLPYFLAAMSLTAVWGFWKIPDRILRISGFMFLGSLAYLVWMQLTSRAYPWYNVPAAFFAAVAISRTVTCLQSREGISKVALSALSAFSIIVMLMVFTGSLRQIEYQQRVVEYGVRRNVGLFLRDHVQPGERVYLEPIGYIGYFSNVEIVDYPGLVSTDTVKTARETGAGFLELPLYLKPEWMVLRPWNWEAFQKKAGERNRYRVVATISRIEEVLNEPFLPGRSYPYTDCAFYILKRTEP